MAAVLLGLSVVAVGVVGYLVLNAITPASTPGHTNTTRVQSCSNPPSGANCASTTASPLGGGSLGAARLA